MLRLATLMLGIAGANAECNKASWPDIDAGGDFDAICGPCTVLVNNFDSKYKSCDKYCEAVGSTCVDAKEEDSETCNVDASFNDVMTCSYEGLESSDALCTCAENNCKETSKRLLVNWALTLWS